MSLPEAIQNLIGSDVRATLVDDVVVEGTLVGTANDTGVIIQTPQHGRRYCWPVTEIELL